MERDPQRDNAAKYERAINIFLIVLGQSFQAVPMAAVALFLPLIRSDLGLSFTEGGTLSAGRIFVYALMEIPAGYLAGCYGLKRIFFLGLFGTTLLTLIFGLVSDYRQAFLTHAATGFFSLESPLASWRLHRPR